MRFVVEGLGTPAPVAAPDRLVVGGPYRYVRNPMYVAVLAVIVGQALLLGQPVLLLYAATIWLMVASFCYVSTRSRPSRAGSEPSTKPTGAPSQPGCLGCARGDPPSAKNLGHDEASAATIDAGNWIA